MAEIHEPGVVADPTQIDVKLFNRWSFDDVQVPFSLNIYSLFRVGYLLIILCFKRSYFGVVNEIFVLVILG